jgi:tRNA pseudouridine55 synthase
MPMQPIPPMPGPTVADRSGGTAVDGLLVMDKATGWTSHDVVARVRRLARTRRVGHAGTLDPMATGVLLVGLGRATRLLGHLALCDKAYVATIRLGQSTVTDDADGELVGGSDAGTLDEGTIRAAMSELTGDLEQVPAAVSAVKVDGKRAYARVRAGEDVALSARPVHVSAFELQEVRRSGPMLDLDVRVECSTGTYVRALARDLGLRLAVGGHLTALRRTRVGVFTDAEAHLLEDLEALTSDALPVLTLEDVTTRVFPTYRVGEELVPAVRNGRRIGATLGASPGPVALVAAAGEFLALYEQDGAEARAVAVFAPA